MATFMRSRSTLHAVRAVAVAACVVTVVSGGPALPAAAAPAKYRPGHAQTEPLVAGRTATPTTSGVGSTGHPFAGAAPVWPTASSVDVSLPPAALRAQGLAGPAAVRGLPVAVDPDGPAATAPTSLRVESYDRAATSAAGVEGLLLRVSRMDGGSTGSARVTVDYRGFRNAFGGDWAARLRLRVLPQCALTTPNAASCQGQDVDTINDVGAGTATAVIPLASSEPTLGRTNAASDLTAAAAGGTVVALTAGTSGGGGNYSATSLSPSATWSAGSNSGDFSWSYPLRVPPSLGGPTPTIALSYSSSGVDGRMASTNNQPSWIGEGFDWQPGSIERRYSACADDMDGANNTVKTGDQCWESDNASLSLAGHAGELLKDASDPNLWHLRNDDGTRIAHRTGASNGDNDGEWWVATTTDGTQYWFGGVSGTNSTLTEPIFGNNTGEPCHQSAFKDSSCTQAYRWQLDRVVDLHGNTMTFTYAKETNRYGRNNTTTDAVVYDRAGYLAKIDYGTRTGDTGNAPMRVTFTVDDRCLSGCTTKDGVHWPDVPWDQDCAASPCKLFSPSFWTTKRLTAITTQVWDPAAAAYRDVESWTLSQSFPDPTDSITPALWLDKISHKGLVGTTTTVPDMTFVGVAMPNRVDTNNDQFPAMNKFRIKTITSETGGKIDVLYSQPDCVKGTRVPDQNALQNNVLRCYPVRWTPDGYTQPINDFFHKYLVTDVLENDLTGSSPRVVTHYDYVGDPAWHYTDDDGFIKKESKTWSVWRGYGAVRTTKGDPGEQTVSEARYFRGMNGDKLPSGTRSVVLPAIAVGNVPSANDEDAFSGMVRENITYNGAAEVSATVSEPWQSSPTATRTINGSTVYARFANTKATHTRTTLDGGRGSRTTSTSTQFDSYGMPVQVTNLGDDAVTGDEKCMLTDYVRNTSVGLVDLVSRSRAFAVDCTTALAGGLTDDQVVSDARTSYDGLAWGATPTLGDATMSESLKAYNGGSPTYITESRTTYDVYGRVLDAYDVRGGKTSTAYTPATGGPLVGTTETSPLGWVKTTVLEPAWKLPLSTTDANGRRIDLAYDGLGRLTSVWLAGRDKATQSPSVTYAYLLRTNAPTVVTTKRVNASGGYMTSYQLYDSLVRMRQTQDSDGAGGAGAVVTDTYYDSAGRAFKTHDAYLAADLNHNPVPPSTELFLPSDTIPSQQLMLYDGAGREVAQVHQVDAPPASPGGTEKWRTTTVYGGDRTDTLPPAGGTVSSELTNAGGNVVSMRQYHPGVTPAYNTATSGYDQTTYTYDGKDQLTHITDAAGRHWDYAYDLRGHQVQVSDPDKGTTVTTYNDAGDIVTATDGRGATIAYTYDQTGRKTSLRDGSVSGPLRAEWMYDKLSNGSTVSGQLVKTIRYVGTDQYVTEYLGLTTDYKPTSVKYTIPGTQTGLAGTYTYVYTYNQDGSVATTRLPAVGDLGLETLTKGYNSLGKPTTLSTSLGSTYVTGTDYTSFNEVGAVHLRNNAGNLADIVRTYETDSRRLSQIWTTRQTAPTTVADVRYGYDAAGNVTKIADLTASDTQCFTTDYLRRLSEAWTPSNGDCTAAPTAGLLGGPARYWQSYTYDVSGSRTGLVQHATPTGDRTTSYTIAAGTHELSGTSTTDNGGTSTGAYTYDTAGNTLTRPTASAGTQTMTWDPEGHLATSTDTTGATSYIYDVDGARLVRIDPTGKTLYLPGQELRYTTTSGAKKGTRYYAHADLTIASRTSGGVTWLSADQHGTAGIAINAVDQTTSIRRETPFGILRATTGTWPTAIDKGFVGGTNDNTGLTHLGAREYDPLVGRFISVDPVVDEKDPQQLHGYAYANNAPVTAIDANGLWPSFVDKAIHNISNAVSTVASTVTTAVKSAASWTYDHAGTISTVLGAAALACSVIPPLQVAAPFLGAASAAFGAIDTYKSCSEGAALDCGLGIVGMIPGCRTIGSVAKGVKGLQTARRALKDAQEGWDAYHDMIRAGEEGSRLLKSQLRRELKDAQRGLRGAWDPDNFEDLHKGFNFLDKTLLGENVFFEGCQLVNYCGEDRQQTAGLRPTWRKNWGLDRDPPAQPSATPALSARVAAMDRRMQRFL
jgi:RHS repeat-associated protein